MLRLFCFCPGILEVIDPLTGHRQHQLCSSQGPMESLSRCPLECPFPSASAVQLRSRLLITGLRQWLFWLTQAARWMHTAALWWHCFLAEAFKALYSEWRLESLVQPCSTLSLLVTHIASTVQKPASADCCKCILVWTMFSWVVLCLTAGHCGMAFFPPPLLLPHSSTSHSRGISSWMSFLMLLIASSFPTCLAQDFFKIFFAIPLYFPGHIQHPLLSAGPTVFPLYSACISTIAHTILHWTFLVCITSLL